MDVELHPYVFKLNFCRKNQLLSSALKCLNSEHVSLWVHDIDSTMFMAREIRKSTYKRRLSRSMPTYIYVYIWVHFACENVSVTNVRKVNHTHAISRKLLVKWEREREWRKNIAKHNRLLDMVIFSLLHIWITITFGVLGFWMFALAFSVWI